MAVVYAKDRYPWRTGEIVSAAVLVLITAALFTLGVLTNTGLLTYALGPLALLLVLIYVGQNIRIKRNRTLNVELNEESSYANFWLNRENKALWGDKLKRDRNQGYLRELRSIAYQHVGVYGVFAFTLRNGKTLYLPERGAYKANVAEFFRQLVQTTLNGRISYSDKAAQTEFEKVLGFEGVRVEVED